MPAPSCNDPDELLVGNLIIEARKQNPHVPAHVIHDLWLARKVRMFKNGRIKLLGYPYVNGNGASY